MKNMIGILLLLIGVILIALPFYKEWNDNQEKKALEKAFLLISESDGEEIDLSKVENLSFTEDEIKKVVELEIPFIQLQQHILSETTDANLDIALTQIKKDQTPGSGNFTVAGHRGFRDGRHFSNLSKVPVGETVYLHAGDTTYVYEVKSSEVIEPTHVEVLNDTPGIDEITLITCTVSGVNRIAVKGELVERMER